MVWYLDDGILLGDEEQLVAALTKVLCLAKAMGIDVNLVKCSLWGPGFEKGTGHLPTSCPLRHVPVTAWKKGSGIKVLGIPVCCPEDGPEGRADAFAKKVWRERVDKASRAMKVLGTFPESHVQYTLLRQCLSACKVNDLLRACPIDEAREECGEMSWQMRRTMGTIAGAPLSESQWEQATLAIRCGGLGINDPVEQRPAARLSGITSFLQQGPRFLGLTMDDDMVPEDTGRCIVEMEERVGSIAPLVGWRREPQSIKHPSKTFSDQNWWSNKVHVKNRDALLASATGADKVRLSCQVRPHANAWLAVAPSVGKKTLLPTVSFVKLLRWTLGMPQTLVDESEEEEKQACPKCDAGLDASGHHMVCCKLNGFTMRHHVVVEALAGIARAAGYPCKKEVSLPDGSKDKRGQLLRPADVLISRFDEHGP